MPVEPASGTNAAGQIDKEPTDMNSAAIFMISVLLWAQTAEPTVTVSDEDEIRAGAALARDFEQQEGMAPTPQVAKLDAYLQSVGDKVAAFAPRKLPYRFHYDPSPGFKSAVGLPGGQIFVGAGIMAYIDSEDQLAMVLGHEISHIALNQCRERLAKELAEKHLSAKEAVTLKVDPYLLGYGHDNEFAADREGVKLAMKAGYSPAGAVRLLRTYVILGEQMPNTPKEAKSNLEARIAQIEEIAKESGGQKAMAEKPLALPQ
jgi:predicted Zn-dependent protease